MVTKQLEEILANPISLKELNKIRNSGKAGIININNRKLLVGSSQNIEEYKRKQSKTIEELFSIMEMWEEKIKNIFSEYHARINT